MSTAPPPKGGLFLSLQQYEKCEKAVKDGLASADPSEKDKSLETVWRTIEKAAKGEYDE